MQYNLDLDAIWSSLENDNSETRKGRILSRRLIPESNFNLYLAVEKPDNIRMLNIRVNREELPDIKSFDPSKGLEFKIISIKSPTEDLVLFSLQLSSTRFSDIFTILVQDIIKVISLNETEKEMVSALLIRIDKWRKFLNKFRGKYLSLEAQQGLLGELIFLKDYVIDILGSNESLKIWKGPLINSKDFKTDKWAVEVKTSASASRSRLVKINSEFQLDDEGIPLLYLFYVELNRDYDGLSLPDQIHTIRNSFKGDRFLLESFNGLLIAYGYLDSDQEQYETPKYMVKDSTFYHVEQKFPRIIVSDLSEAINRLKYNLNLKKCVEFIVPKDQAVLNLEDVSNDNQF